MDKASHRVKPVFLGLTAAVAAGLGIWSVAELTGIGRSAATLQGEAETPDDTGVSAAPPEAGGARAVEARTPAPSNPRAHAWVPRGRPASDPEPRERPAPIDATEASTRFEEALGRLDRRLEGAGPIPRDDWSRLYRQSNDALAAYSTVLDAREPDDLKTLEDAHLRLATRLERLEPRVAKPPRPGARR